MSRDDILDYFRTRLEMEPLALNTRRQYYKKAMQVISRISWERPTDIKSHDVVRELDKLGTGSAVSAARNGLRLFCKYFPECELYMPQPIELGKRNKPTVVISKRELKQLLFFAFSSGCVCGYGIDHMANVNKQEQQGFEKMYLLLDDRYKLQKGTSGTLCRRLQEERSEQQ